MEETLSQNSPIKWTVYYEDEKDHSKPVVDLVSDLDYLKKWFTWHKTWAHKEGKPVIFVWNEDGCEVADRWMRAASQAGWYVVLKLFSGYRDCPVQPDSWHQYVSNTPAWMNVSCVHDKSNFLLISFVVVVAFHDSFFYFNELGWNYW
jgi:hypothetical protein